MEDHAVVFLACAGQESGDVDECDQRNVECVAEAYETRAFAGCVAVEYSGEVFGLVSHDADRLAVEACEAYDDVFGVVALYFEEFSVVDNGADYFVHVVGTCGRVGDYVVEGVFEAVDGVVAFFQRSFLKVVLGYVAEKFAYDLEGVFAVVCGKVADTAFR